MTNACQLAYFAATSRHIRLRSRGKWCPLDAADWSPESWPQIAPIRERWLAIPNSDEEPEAEQYGVTRAESDETGSGRSRSCR
jgi:hypothetical protein